MSEEESILEEPEFQDDLEETERLEKLALDLQDAIPVRSLPKQEYLEATVIPLLLEGISWIVKERPEDPVESLAMFLIKNNPNEPETQNNVDTTNHNTE
ncbi:Dpy-30 motif family protein [Histomonas meleagridis]|uniref:Dpy-30 motif family protein n=1 Tax=Histomonas meleagridis TaxID=135588 RepID=UPI00355A844F|nr:Dpy-30 motif family protein [Histomonas meleagridis]KAH0805353.1 Dpy-30 motif family protein [Histomonas meleagridis]